jgi:hypothetical protein
MLTDERMNWLKVRRDNANSHFSQLLGEDDKRE